MFAGATFAGATFGGVETAIAATVAIWADTTATWGDASYQWSGGGGTSAFTGTASLSGSGTFVITAGVAAINGAATLAGSGTLTATFLIGSAALSGSGSLTVPTATLAILDPGSYSDIYSSLYAGAVTPAGTGTLTAAAPRTALFTGSGTLTALSLYSGDVWASSTDIWNDTIAQWGVLPGPITGSAALSGTGALSAAGTEALSATVGLSGAGTLVAGSATVTVTGSAALSGSGTLAVPLASPAVHSSVALSGSGTLGAQVTASSVTGFGTSRPTGLVGQSTDTAGYTMATAFSVTVAGQFLTAIRVYLDSASGAITAAQMTNSGADPLRANVFVNQPNDGGASGNGLQQFDATMTTPVMDAWNEFPLTTPIELIVGQVYYAAVCFPHGRYSAQPGLFNTEVDVASIKFPADNSTQGITGTVRNGAYTSSGAGLVMTPPDGHFGGTWYGIDIKMAPSTDRGSTLAMVPWEGGPAYYSSFSHATASGMTSPSFFPLLVDYEGVSTQTDINADKAYGVNGYYRLIDDANLSLIHSNGMIAFPGVAVTATPGDETVGWNVDDEVDMWAGVGWNTWNGNGPGQGTGPNANSGYDAMYQLTSATGRQGPRIADGRMKHMNYGLGVVFWYGRDDARIFVNGGNNGAGKSFALDAVSVDAYFYTSTDTESPQWLGIPAGETHRAINYGEHAVKRVRDLQALDSAYKPVYGFVEVASQTAAHAPATFTDDMIEGAVWACLIFEARGIIYFNHDFVWTGSAHVLRDNAGSHTARVTDLNARITALAPVLNTQSYAWQYNYDTWTMTKHQGGYWWIFAMSRRQATHDTTARHFTMPLLLPQSGTITVVNESRTIPLSGGTFSDAFAAESTAHIYKIADSGVIVAGSASLGGAGTLAVPLASPALTGAAALSSSGTLTSPSGVAARFGTSALSGSGTLLAAGLALTGTSALSGSGTLTAPSAVTGYLGIAGLSGTGTLFASAASFTGTATLSGSGTLVIAGVAGITGAASLGSVGTLSNPTASLAVPGAVTLSGIGQLNTAGLIALFGSVGFSGSGSLTSVGYPSIVGGSAALSGVGGLVLGVLHSWALKLGVPFIKWNTAIPFTKWSLGALVASSGLEVHSDSKVYLYIPITAPVDLTSVPVFVAFVPPFGGENFVSAVYEAGNIKVEIGPGTLVQLERGVTYTVLVKVSAPEETPILEAPYQLPIF